MPDDDEYTLDEIKTALRRKLNLMGPDERETALRELERNPNLSDVVNEYRYPTPGAWTEEAFKPAAPIKLGGYLTRKGVTTPTEVEYGPTPEPPRKRVTWAPPSTPPVGAIPGVYWPGGMPTPPVGTEPYWRVPTAEETIKATGKAGVEAAKTVGRTFQGKKPFGLLEIGKPEETPPPEGLPGVVGRMVPSFLGFGEPLTLEELRQQPPWMQAAMATGMGAPLESLALAAQQAPAALRTATTGLKQRGRAVLATGERGAVGPLGEAEPPGIRFTAFEKGRGPANPQEMYNWARGALQTDELSRRLTQATTAPRLTAKNKAAAMKIIRDAEKAHPEWKQAYEAFITEAVTPAVGGFSKEEISTKVRQFQEDYWRKNPPPSTDITSAKMKGKSRQELWSERFRKATKEYEASLEAVTPAAKEPWQMTFRELDIWRRSLDTKAKVEANVEAIHTLYPEVVTADDAWRLWTRNRLESSIIQSPRHKAAIQRAISEGKSVPPEVLVDYPDLVAKGKPDEVLDYMINFYNEKGGKAIRHPTEPGFIYVDDSLLSEAAAKDKLRNFMEIEGEKLEQRVKAEAALAKGKPLVTEVAEGIVPTREMIDAIQSARAKLLDDIGKGLGQGARQERAEKYLAELLGNDPAIRLYRGVGPKWTEREGKGVGQFWTSDIDVAKQYARGQDIYQVDIKASEIVSRKGDIVGGREKEWRLEWDLQQRAVKLGEEAKPPVTEIPKIEAGPPKVKVEVPPTEPPVKPLTEGPPPPPVVSKVKPPPGEVPPAPVVTPEGKLWLPEPPRTGAYMESARKEVAGSFRKKIGVFDIVEQAHQQVLKARDLGENAINYVGSYLRQAGNMTKEFGLDAQGIATKVGNPEGRSLAINDILSNYTHYTLTPAQIEIAKRHGFIYREALKLAKSYGVDISELGGPDEYWQYIARRVKGKLNPATGQFEMPPSVTGGFRMGAKISAQKERVFEEMAQGVDLGLLYEHPDQVVVQHLKGIYRLIGNKQAEDTVKGLTRAITAEAPVVFGERALAQPALRSRAAAVELANAIDKIFTPEQEIKALRIMADISGALVGQTAALDVSAPFIQGLPVLGHDLKMALKGQPTAIWAKAYARMWRAVWNPKTIDTFRAANHDLYKRAQEAGVITGQSEFVSGVPVTGRMLGKVPGVGKTLKEAYRQTWGRAGQAYSDFLEVSRIKMFEQMEGAWERSGGNVYDLGAVVNRMSGATSAAARGVGTTRRLVERIAAFAPNYIRASLLLIKDMAGRRATAKEVQSTLAALLGVGFAVYYAEEKVRGREPKIKPWPKRLGGDGAEAFTTEIFGYRVGFGSWMYGMIKTLAEIGAIAVDDPSALVVFDEQHPLMRFAKSKQGPALSLTRELVTGKNFWGEDFETPQDYLLRVVEAITPISGQSLVQKGTGLPKTTVERATPLLLEPLGLRVFPSNISKFTELAEKQGIARGREWPELEPWEKAKISMSPEGRVLIKALNQKETVKRWQIRWDAYDMQLKRDAEFKAGKIKGSNWKDAYYQAQSELAARLNQFDEDFKRMRYNPETPEDKALSGYYDTMDKAKSETGVFDGDKWEELRATYMTSLAPELQKYVEDNIGNYDTPQAQNFRRVREILEPYWNLEAQVWSQYGAQAETLKDLATRLDVMATTDERKAKQFMLENPQLVSRIFTAQKQIANLKLAWKAKHLDEAALLKKFYTY